MSHYLPYNFRRQGNSHRFQTDNGVYYNVEFSEGSFYFSDFPDYLSVFEFSISVITLGDNISPPLDLRVEATVVAILENFLYNHENSIIYTCETLDNRQKSRHRKFDMWFKQNTHALLNLEKHDAFITYEELEILSSLIVHKQNPYKDELVKIFFEQASDYNKE